ncbi:MAG: hypothetical protein K6G06_01270 [Butyrivibrio sp.]|nr:hypothetical protein [Butyrivibrio sp.]
MRITDSSVNLVSERRYTSYTTLTKNEQTQSVQNPIDRADNFKNSLQNICLRDNDKNTGEQPQSAESKNAIEAEQKEETLFTNYNAKGRYAVGNTSDAYNKVSEIENLRMQIMERLLNIMQILYGESNKDSKLKSFMEKLSSQVNSGSYQFMNVQTMNYTHVEEEHTAFKAQGVALTEDGRELSFNVSVSMSRTFTETVGIQYMRPVNLIDPLIINVGSEVTRISDQTFTFDLDADEKEDEIKKPGLGSGFLALDKNGDGIINDGTELFGAISGDGFAELSEYDSDHDSWIDEDDEIYEKLRVWCKGEDGKDSLLTLKEADVGAIYLGNAETDFTNQGSDFLVNARFRKSGVFLKESGGTGVIHQIDLAKTS